MLKLDLMTWLLSVYLVSICQLQLQMSVIFIEWRGRRK